MSLVARQPPVWYASGAIIAALVPAAHAAAPDPASTVTVTVRAGGPLTHEAQGLLANEDAMRLTAPRIGR